MDNYDKYSPEREDLYSDLEKLRDCVKWMKTQIEVPLVGDSIVKYHLDEAEKIIAKSISDKIDAVQNKMKPRGIITYENN